MLDFLFRWFRQSSAAVPTTAYTQDDGGDTGRNTACNRLKLVLMHDRTQLEPEKLALMRDELVQVISNYIPIDREAIELNLEKDPETNTVALVANIPVRFAGERLVTTETSAADDPLATADKLPDGAESTQASDTPEAPSAPVEDDEKVATT